jgi:hypothetical protein
MSSNEGLGRHFKRRHSLLRVGGPINALSWRLSGPSPHEFIDALVGLLSAISEDGSEDDNASSSLLLIPHQTFKDKSG